MSPLHVVVVGAGVFGAWTAWRLASAGHRVTLIDAYGPATGRASSADHSRVIRAGYGADGVYSRWATDSRAEWSWLAQATGQALMATTGALFLGEPSSEYVRDTYTTLGSLGLRAEWLEPRDLRARFPQIAVAGLGPALFEPDAGVLRARAGVRALVDYAVGRRCIEYRQVRVAPLDEQRSRAEVRETGGTPVEADAFVFACGPWLPSLFPVAIGRRIRPTRQEVLYFGVPDASSLYSVDRLPVWIDFAAGLYGIPDLDGWGFKVGIDRHGPPIDPDVADRLVDPQVVAATRAFLAIRFPALAAAPLVDSRVCQYENTASGDFLIDRHPAWPNVWIAGGGSGHGFKHGPAVGRHVAALVEGGEAVDPRFALASQGTATTRTVH